MTKSYGALSCVGPGPAGFIDLEFYSPEAIDRRIPQEAHAVRLIPPIYVKPFVKRHKNDAADAEAITEAALRPGMSFIAPKSAQQHALTMMMRTREQLLEQRPVTVNASRGHLAGFGTIAPVGIRNAAKLKLTLADAEDVLALVIGMTEPHFDRIDRLTDEIEALTAKIRLHCRRRKTG